MDKNENNDNKETRLLNTAFKLFTEKGVKSTSIQEIVDNANVAKGTFYLYFKDKYEIRDILIAKKSHKLFNDAASLIDDISAVDTTIALSAPAIAFLKPCSIPAGQSISI